MLVKQVLKEALYQINFPTSERREALYHALDRLVGLRPEDFIEYFEELHQSTEKTIEKRRYTQDIKFIKENFQLQ